MVRVPSWKQPQVVHLEKRTRFEATQFVNEPLFDGDGFYGRLLCFQKGQQVPEHVHDHVDECFDVLEGEGTFLINGQVVVAGPGTHIYIPAGTRHALQANRTERWVLRETVHERVYARRALRLLGRALLKRLPVIGTTYR